MILHVFFLLCLFSCFVCGQRFQIPHRGPESRCLVQWLRRQSCTNIFYFGKSQRYPKTLCDSHSQPSRTFEIWTSRGICCVHLIWEEEGWSICFHYLNTIWPPTRCPLKSYMRPSAISLCHLNSKWLETACCLAHDLGWRHQIFYHPFHLIIFSQNRETSKICFN